uniref:Uncharacterized protein AlNc14C12G1470 n=1 Tax=Albugo laibachii Nc14 TaxID=890382 RepID=F0W393_9STRA|nr:conserved hypothetical protein [Albugo laibachii Nc14]|eukprot:CCA15536.1 conserved hypothetical protein [Albugo laibachii Nc14]
MEQVAQVLQQYANGLTESFDLAMTRIEESISKSTETMKVMNSVMESAILQNLKVDVLYSQQHNALDLEITNQSPIQLSKSAINVQIKSDSEEDNAIPIFERVLEVWKASESFQFRIPLSSVPTCDHFLASIDGDVVIELTSPGTHLMISRKESFRISFLEFLRFTAVKDNGAAGSAMNQNMFHSHLLRVSELRKLLKPSPYDALLTSTEGFYKMEWDENQQKNLKSSDPFCLHLLVQRQSNGHDNPFGDVMLAAFDNSNKVAMVDGGTVAMKIVKEFERMALSGANQVSEVASTGKIS